MKRTAVERTATMMETIKKEAREYWRWPVGEAAMRLLEAGKPVTPEALLDEVRNLADTPKNTRQMLKMGLEEAIARLQKLAPERHD